MEKITPSGWEWLICHRKYWPSPTLILGMGTPRSDFPGGSDGKASAYNAGDPGSIPRSGRSPGEGNGNPLQYSCLENPTDTVHRVAKSQSWLSDFTPRSERKRDLPRVLQQDSEGSRCDSLGGTQTRGKKPRLALFCFALVSFETLKCFYPLSSWVSSYVWWIGFCR